MIGTLLGVSEAAKLLLVSGRTLYNMIKKKKIESVKIPTGDGSRAYRRMIPEKEIERLIKESTIKALPKKPISIFFVRILPKIGLRIEYYG